EDQGRCMTQQRWWVPGQRDFYQEISKEIPTFFCANDKWIVPHLVQDKLEDSVEWILGTQKVRQGATLSFGESDSAVEIILIRHLKGGCQDQFTWTVPIHRVPPIEIHTQGQCVDAPVVISIVKPEDGLQFALEVEGEKTSFSKSLEFIHTFSSEGTYPVQVRAMYALGCQTIQNIDLEVFPQPDIPIAEAEAGCQPEMGSVWAMGNDLSDHLQWKTLEGEIRRTPSPYVWEESDFYPDVVQAVSKQGCISQPYEISWFDWTQSMWKVKWEETVQASGHIVIDGEIEGPEASFEWSDGRGHLLWGRKVEMVLTDTGRYLPSVKVTTPQGCNWVFEGEEVQVVPSQSSAIILPDAFSPNGDGINDVFFLTLQKTEGVIFNVFNNWGLEVFRASSGTIRWDGRDMQGRPVRPGVYSYQLTFNDTQGQPVRRSGTLTVLY
ncbi:MAG: gliding motility-associated C-terminal domain-containing protein, partial [Bacteroidota bacterium]